ncbi:MAG: exodeoxyribonuclease VII large subunit [Gammaproteobacteria bacterium]|nr:exodeoxyribonuclease VII large subunit [Gammaproteobacteria bacterium]MBU1777156.1 exodeoxyribonuclease VII large subunit [Gammaproteobacteria bacterium]MBU1967824.1 exodeoxyribonuclease VII large subunit [Gammaproteobacteria bacterium]
MLQADPKMDRNRVLSVRELNLAAKQIIENGLPLMWVRGEISNYVCAASGHWYFSLKDESAQVRCVMFRHKSQYLDIKPANGMQVEVLALPTMYEARGDFQLNLEKMRPAGLGALFEAFERLKTRLEGEGLFDAERKRDLPLLPKQIGIVTSPQAAALRDVLRTLANRMPNVPVVLYPTPVQGEGAGAKIAQAIRTAGERAECDILIVCRGGGSIEDLWAFNEEVVARAIAASHIPVVSGVGHETDFTIADFVADLRAATPTAAAQAVVPDRGELRQRLVQQHRHLQRAASRQFEQRMQQVDFLQRRLVHPAQLLRQQAERMDALQQRMRLAQAYAVQRQQGRWNMVLQRLRALRPDITRLREQQGDQARRLGAAMQHTLQRHDARLQALQQHLLHLDPQQVLARGYSLVRDARGNIVVSSERIAVGDKLDITFAQGGASATVQEKRGA